MERFPFINEKGHIISIVGAGGKTTLMYRLAECFAGQGMRVLVTTTTHIFKPEGDKWAKNRKELQILWSQGMYAVMGKACGGGKLEGLPEQELVEYMQDADIVLIEADGAKGMPCKVPAEHEPVIWETSDIVIGVMGMSALGKPLQEVCFRKKEAKELLGVSETEQMSVELMAEILASDRGTRKNVGDREFYVVLNQCDCEERVREGEKIRHLLKEQKIQGVVLTSLKEEGA